MIRQPIVVLVGHVDHGKTSILDKIRGTAIAKAEPGLITQCISCTKISLDLIKKICGNLLEKLKIKFTIPGLLFLDTPGHAAFNNLRKRGGNLADIAILVIDINEGIKEQTRECIEILKNYKTPFIIAFNKIDLISGWQIKEGSLLEKINKQSENIKKELDKRIYDLVGSLYKLGFNSERFDRVEDYTKQVAIIPVSAKTGEGIAELLMVLTGLAQKYLEKSLNIEVKGPAKGTILEVKEEKRIGPNIDIIIYDGTIKQNDTIVIGSLDKVIVTKIRNLLEPEIRKKGFINVKEVNAAAGVKIVAPDLDEVIAGMPLRVATEKDLEKIKKEIRKEVDEVLIETEKEGIIVKADSLGSLEALTGLLKLEKIPIKKASIGDINKKDLTEASTEENELNKVVLGFNVKALESKEIKIITHNVIYQIIEDFKNWKIEKEKEIESKKLEGLVRPCKIKLLRGCVFRQSKPAVVGVIVLGGILKTNISLMKEDGSKVGEIKSMQLEMKNIDKAEKDKEVAISLPNITVGRQIKEDDILISDINEENFKKLKEMKKFLSSDELEILKEIALIKRKQDNMWGL